MEIRKANPEDLPDINKIYNQAVKQRFCTAHLEAIDMETREKWFHSHDPGHFPVFVAIDKSRITGWVSLGAYRGGRQALAHVAEVSYYVDENTQSQTVFLRIKAIKNQTLLAGEYLKAIFPVRPIKNAMEIPRNSVFNTNEVFVVRGGRLAKEMINVIKENERTLIFNGITEGDTIVVQQLINVSEGTLVQTDKDAPGKPGQGDIAAKGKKAKR